MTRRFEARLEALANSQQATRVIGSRASSRADIGGFPLQLDNISNLCAVNICARLRCRTTASPSTK